MALCLICCLALAAWALMENHFKSGVAIVKLDLSRGLKDILPRQIPQVPDFVDSVKSGVEDRIKTAIPEAVSRVRSAADAVATHVSDAVNSAVPKTFYVGIRYLCVGDMASRSCHNLPLRLSNVISSGAHEALKKALGDPRSLDDSALSVITAPHIRNCFIAGIASIIVAFLVFTSLLRGWCQCLTEFSMPFKLLRAFLYFAFGLVCSIPFMIAVGLQITMRSVLPSWISMQHGDVFGISIGCLCCGCALALLGGSLPLFV